jgi:hypothetical protein
VDNLERSVALKRDAAALLADTGLDALLRKHGKVAYVGSFALDLMAWPDIDVNMVLSGGQSITGFMRLFSAIAEIPGVTQISFLNTLDEQLVGRPQGLYAGVRLHRKVRWKVDLWCVAPSAIDEHQREMEDILADLDGESRAAILNAKFDLLTAGGRTLIGSGHLIYEAVLSKGLRRTTEIRDYLRDQGIEGI